MIFVCFALCLDYVWVVFSAGFYLLGPDLVLLLFLFCWCCYCLMLLWMVCFSWWFLSCFELCCLMMLILWWIWLCGFLFSCLLFWVLFVLVVGFVGGYLLLFALRFVLVCILVSLCLDYLVFDMWVGFVIVLYMLLILFWCCL